MIDSIMCFIYVVFPIYVINNIVYIYVVFPIYVINNIVYDRFYNVFHLVILLDNVGGPKSVSLCIPSIRNLESPYMWRLCILFSFTNQSKFYKEIISALVFLPGTPSQDRLYWDLPFIFITAPHPHLPSCVIWKGY